jgi:hypothetical protein
MPAGLSRSCSRFLGEDQRTLVIRTTGCRRERIERAVVAIVVPAVPSGGTAAACARLAPGC